MSDNREVMDFLAIRFNRLDKRHDELASVMLEVKERLGFLEGQCASISRRVDRIDQRIERIERRLDIADAPA